MKIVLVVPPKSHPHMRTLRDEICFQNVPYTPFPLRFAAVAPMLREAADVEIVDANALDWDWVRLERELPAADLFVYKSAAGLIRGDSRVGEIVKRKFGREAKVALVETTLAPLYPERMLNDFTQIDFIVRGQVEVVLPALARGLREPGSVLGIAYRRDREIAATPPAQPAPDLDSIPFMAYDLLPVDRYSISYLAAPRYERIVPGIRMRTTRDCPYLCPFCIIGTSVYRGYDRRWRSMSPERVVAELEHVKNRHGVGNVFFWDETFTLDQKRATRLCELMIERRLGMLWRCLTRMDCVSPELLESMAGAGCRHIEYGLEAGDPESRAANHKNFGDDVVRRVVADTQAAGMAAHVDVIVGMPWETRETLDHTLHLINDLHADNVHLTMAFPYPETEFYKTAEARGLLQFADIYSLMIDERVRVGATPYVRSEALAPLELLAGWERIRRESDRHFFFHHVLLSPTTLLRYARLCLNPHHLAQISRRAARSLRHLVPARASRR
ncbi:MAG: radical SAM protein [Acidobacteriota bacterium]